MGRMRRGSELDKAMLYAQHAEKLLEKVLFSIDRSLCPAKCSSSGLMRTPAQLLMGFILQLQQNIGIWREKDAGSSVLSFIEHDDLQHSHDSKQAWSEALSNLV